MCRRNLSSSNLFLVSILYAANNCAGPPLVIDDPGILKPGQWETILAADAVNTDFIRTYDLPLLDVSYGLTEDTQMSVVFSRQHVELPGESIRSDFGYGEIAWKWCFFKSDSLELAVGPGYSVPLSSDATIRGVIEDTRFLSLPILAGYSKGGWTLNAQAAYIVGLSEGNGYDYGVAVGYQFPGRLQVFFEVYGVTGTHLSSTDANYNVGIDYGFSNSFHLLISARRSMVSDLPESDQLNHGLYLALQWFR